jgi:hypothetical protein
MSVSSMFRPRILPSGQSRGILKPPREAGESGLAWQSSQPGGAGSVFSRFMWGRRNGRCSLRPLAGLLSSTGYGVGKVLVALFLVIALALFLVIAFFANVAHWPCFWLSHGPLFGYHTQ